MKRGRVKSQVKRIESRESVRERGEEESDVSQVARETGAIMALYVVNQ
jgi:hypothetical protein